MPALAVTLAVRVAVRVVVAPPVPSVGARGRLTAPPAPVKETGTPGSRLPAMSRTRAAMVDEPPAAGSVAGLAVNVSDPTAAVPTAIFSAFAALTDAAPDVAVIVAVPLARPALN